MENLKEFWNKYRGAIIGVIIAILIIWTRVYKFFVAVIVIIVFAIIGNYIQANKEFVKEKLKNFIDRF